MIRKFIVFVERIFDPETYQQLKDFIMKYGAENVSLYCLTHVNYDLIRAEQGYEGSREALRRVMGERYYELQKMGCHINLHLHLSLVPGKLDLWKEGKMFKESVEWMNDCNFNPTEWMAGWYAYTPISIEIGKKYGLKYNKNKGKYHIHDYQLNSVFSLMNILANIRGWFR